MTKEELEKRVAALEAELAEAKIFRQFAENAGQGLGMATLEGELIYVNPSSCRIVGVANKEDLIGHPIGPLYPSEFQDRLQNEVLPTVMQKGQWVGELAMLSPQGKITPTLENIFLIRDEAGQPLYLANVMTDLTEQKQTKAQIEAEVEKRTRELTIFKAIVETSPTALFVIDITDKPIITYANRTAYEQFGFDYKTQELMGQSAEAGGWFQEAASFMTETALPQVMATGGWEGEIQQKRRDGTTFPSYATIFLIYDGEGQMTSLVVIIRDITAQREVDAEHQRLLQEVVDTQRRAILELSTPIIPLMDRIIVMPLIGSIDSLRAREITRSLLAGISQHRAKIVILDITGVPLVDSGVASHLNKTIQAARLKGARTIVTGVSDAVAETIVDLGIDWGGTETLANLQTGLVAALNSLGIKLGSI